MAVINIFFEAGNEFLNSFHEFQDWYGLKWSTGKMRMLVHLVVKMDVLIFYTANFILQEIKQFY
jgi:hypothetical protein